MFHNPQDIKHVHFISTAVLTLGNASITDTILEVAKVASIPVINPKVNLHSLRQYRNFVSLSVRIDYEVQVILCLLIMQVNYIECFNVYLQFSFQLR